MAIDKPTGKFGSPPPEMQARRITLQSLEDKRLERLSPNELHNIDKEGVERAETHLRTLLADPYYAEAFQRLRRKKDKVVSDRPGLLPAKGKYARSLRSSKITKPKKVRGRPAKANRGLDFLLTQFGGRTNKISLAEFMRRVLKSEFPSMPQDLIERKAQEFAAALRARRSYTKRQKLA